MRLISNNPVKRAGPEGYGIEIVETIPLIIESNPYNRFYLETKANKMGYNPHATNALLRMLRMLRIEIFLDLF